MVADVLFAIATGAKTYNNAMSSGGSGVRWFNQNKRLFAVFALSCMVYGVIPNTARGYGVLTHEAIVDVQWDGPMKAVLRKRFPGATDEELAKAHAYAYGGCIIQDLGYYPFGNKFFSDLLHYVRSADFLQILLDESRDLNEYAFALGAVAHYGADTEGHQLAINPTVALMYPKLRRKFGNSVTYGDDPKSHIRTEFAFDVVQVAQRHYASQTYHDFVGFEVSKDLIERAFVQTYGIEVRDFYSKFDLSVKTYRYSVSKLIPEMTRAAWAAKSKEIQQTNPGVTQQKFLFNLHRSAYEKEWGHEYQKPGCGARFLALLIRIVPKVGPFRGLGFRIPPPEAERMFETSFDASVDRNRRSYAEANTGTGILKIPNLDLDTGKPVSPGEYDLTDRTYDKLLAMLAAKRFQGVTPELRLNILNFYGKMKSPDRHGMAPQVEALRAAGS